MSLQLQQNLYSIYRLCLKLPRYVFIASLVLLLLLAASQFTYMINNTNRFDISQCLLDYVVEKHARAESKNVTENVTQNKNQTQYDEFVFLDSKTLINIEFGSGKNCEFAIDYSYKYNAQTRPLMVIVENQHLSYLGLRPDEYFKSHGITFDKLSLPQRQFEYPLFSFFMPKDMLVNQLLIQSIRESAFNFDTLFQIYVITNNITNPKLTISELFLSFYSQEPDSETVYRHTFNLIRFIALKQFPQFLLKLFCALKVLFLLYMMSIFIGLFIRYIVFFTYTAFLIIYDKCMKESWGWVHLYLGIIYNRFRQNGVGTFKMLVFYVVSNLGMNFLLAFGSYCIIRRIIYPLLPFLIDSYTEFFFKIIFCVELYVFVFCRSRTALRFFPILSFVVSFVTLLLISLEIYGNNIILLNLCLTLQLALFIGFLLVQQAIINQNQKGFIGQYCPSMSKPRMLFYAGYDISWEKSLPPIWTYFTSWFDYSYFSEAEKCLVQKDYQLLYGRLLGLNDRQQIPQVDQEEQERNRLNDHPSYEMNLIQNDV